MIQQRGSVLIFCLVVLMILTLLALNAMSASFIQTRMTGNSLSQLDALNNAETAARLIEQQLIERDSADDLDSAFTTPDAGFYPAHTAPASPHDNTQWLPGTTCITVGTSTTSLHAPCAKIESLSTADDRPRTRITIRATDAGGAVALIQTHHSLAPDGRLAWRELRRP